MIGLASTIYPGLRKTVSTHLSSLYQPPVLMDSCHMTKPNCLCSWIRLCYKLKRGLKYENENKGSPFARIYLSTSSKTSLDLLRSGPLNFFLSSALIKMNNSIVKIFIQALHCHSESGSSRCESGKVEVDWFNQFLVPWNIPKNAKLLCWPNKKYPHLLYIPTSLC